MKRGAWEVSADGQRRWALTDWQASSVKYGACEVCGKHCTEVYHQAENLRFDLDEIDIADGLTDGWTYHGATDLVGHESCLRSARGAR